MSEAADSVSSAFAILSLLQIQIDMANIAGHILLSQRARTFLHFTDSSCENFLHPRLCNVSHLDDLFSLTVGSLFLPDAPCLLSALSSSCITVLETLSMCRNSKLCLFVFCQKQILVVLYFHNAFVKD